MPEIRQLPAHVADLIAAGEVVERPASVVKELVENALDAGASAVVVEIRRGGMGLIRVTDNGCGIAPEQLPTAFLRHATSKLRRAEDLGAIGTLGFRGEALAAIAAVSRVEILTRRPEDASGAVLRLEGGQAGPVEEAGAPEGTTIAVRDLFFNTPARLKFMRKDSAETAAVAGLMQHLALSHPAVSFRFVKDGAEAMHTPGDGRLDSAVYAALGRDFARGLVPAEGRGGEVAVSGFITAPLMGRGSRAMQTFFVNGRYIKSQLLTAALEEGYRNQIMKGKFPGCVLAVTLPAAAVDVNVHPAKTQVKFAREREVFDAVYHTVLDALEARGGAVSAPPKTAPRPEEFFQRMDAAAYRARTAEKPAARQEAAPKADAFRRADAAAYQARSVGAAEVRAPLSAPARGSEAAPQAASPREAAPVRPVFDTEWKRSTVADSAGGFAYRTARQTPDTGGGAFAPDAAPGRDLAPQQSPERSAEEAPPRRTPAISAAPVSVTGQTALDMPAKPFVPAIPDGDQVPGQQVLPAEEAPWRIAGEVLRTYIVCESADGCVWLIDKHAAHERINFDRLCAAKEPPMRQTLLQPAVVQLEREDAALLLENLELLKQAGFACEDFGDGAVLVREVPSDIDAGDAPAVLEEFAGQLRTGRSLEERRESLLHTMACKAAIKGGWKSDPAELRVLVEKVQRGEVRFCPHGRPVAVKLTKYELEKMFKRA